MGKTYLIPFLADLNLAGGASEFQLCYYLIPRNHAKVWWPGGMLRDITSANKIPLILGKSPPSLGGLNVSATVVQIVGIRNRKSWDSSHLPSEKRYTDIRWFSWTNIRYSSCNLFTLQACWFADTVLSLTLIWWDFGSYFYGPK